MACRTLDITLISAKNLRDVNNFSTMEVYAVASLSGDPRTMQRTPTDSDGETNPTWNYTVHFTVPADDVAACRLVLHILLRTERLFGTDRDVGEVHVPLKQLLKGAGTCGVVGYEVTTPFGDPQGVLNFSYKVGKNANLAPAKANTNLALVKAAPNKPPVKTMRNPAPVKPTHNSVPYEYAVPSPYGYPPAVYGQAPTLVVVQQPKKSSFWKGVGKGLLGVAIGGLLIADMVASDDTSDSDRDDGLKDADGNDS